MCVCVSRSISKFIFCLINPYCIILLSFWKTLATNLACNKLFSLIKSNSSGVITTLGLRYFFAYIYWCHCEYGSRVMKHACGHAQLNISFARLN